MDPKIVKIPSEIYYFNSHNLTRDNIRQNTIESKLYDVHTWVFEVFMDQAKSN